MNAFLVAEFNGLESSKIQDYFISEKDEMSSQGNWSDGTPVNPLIYSQDPFGERGGENLALRFLTAHSAGPEICRP